MLPAGELHAALRRIEEIHNRPAATIKDVYDQGEQARRIANAAVTENVAALNSVMRETV